MILTVQAPAVIAAAHGSGYLCVRVAGDVVEVRHLPGPISYYPVKVDGAEGAEVVLTSGLTLDEAHATLTDGKTKAELVALGDDLGLSLSDSSLKADLLDAIRAHLETL